MKKFWNQTVEFKAFMISLIAMILAIGGTSCLFFLGRYEIPLAVLTSGIIVTLTWFLLYLNKKKGEGRIKLDIFAIYLRLSLIVVLTIIFAILQLTLKIVIISPIFLVVSYLGYSLLTFIAFIGKDKNV
ncbi:MAG: hypothetical protein J6N95_04075 [Bacilli bacterium]|nr:hypothetical protein [Bacilli bacterium]